MLLDEHPPSTGILGRHPEQSLSAAMKPVAFIIDLSVIMCWGDQLAALALFPIVLWTMFETENCLMGLAAQRGCATR